MGIVVYLSFTENLQLPSILGMEKKADAFDLSILCKCRSISGGQGKCCGDISPLPPLWVLGFEFRSSSLEASAWLAELSCWPCFQCVASVRCQNSFLTDSGLLPFLCSDIYVLGWEDTYTAEHQALEDTSVGCGSVTLGPHNVSPSWSRQWSRTVFQFPLHWMLVGSLYPHAWSSYYSWSFCSSWANGFWHHDETIGA